MKQAVAVVLVVLLAASVWWWLARDGAVHAGVAIGGGDGGLLPRAAPAEEHLSAAAVAAARAAAADHRLECLLVARHGHLLLEYYAAPAHAIGLRAGGALSAALLAQLGDAPPANATTLAAALSRQIWQPLNAQQARLVSGQVQARAVDWLRVGLLLLGRGQFEGTEVSSAARIADVHYESARPAGEALASREVRELRGPAGLYLWLEPALQLAVLHAGGTLGGADTLLINQLIRAVEDRADAAAQRSLLNQLVPGH